MRIAITGAHLVGKTTLAEKLQESLLHYELYAEPYHELGEMGYIFSESPTSDEYIIQLEHSIKQIENSENDAIFDRCPLDFLAYAQAVDYTYNSQSIFNKVQKTMSKIDLLVFVPIEIDQFMIRRNYAKTFEGFKTRLLSKIMALTVVQFINKEYFNRNINNLKVSIV
ncbi:MAG: AAA family ATPase [Cloacibacterium sp.]